MDVWTIAGGVVVGVLLLLVGFIAVAFFVSGVRVCVDWARENPVTSVVLFVMVLYLVGAVIDQTHGNTMTSEGIK